MFLRTNLLMAIVTLMVWAMSPIGGQSSSRLLFTDNRVDTNPMTLFYPNITKVESWLSSGSGLDDVEAILSTIYSASLLTSPGMKGALTDMWDRPKVPKWNLHAHYQTDNDGWREIDKQALLDGIDDYSSLVGLKMEGFTLDEDVTYKTTVQSSYIDFNCSLLADALEKDDAEKFIPARRLNVSSLYFKGISSLERQAPLTGVFEVPGNVSYFDWKEASGTDPLTFLMALRAETDGTLGISYFDCTAAPVVVETELSCGPNPSVICSPEKQRRLHADKPAGLVWPDNMFTTSMFNTVKAWQRASIVVDHHIASATELYLAGETVLFRDTRLLTWDDVDMDVFSRRMTTAYNTIWQSSLDPFNATTASLRLSADGQNTRRDDQSSSGVALPFDALNQTLMGDPFRAIIPAESTVSKTTEVYRANRKWIGILIAATAILEIIAIASAVFEFITLAPDVLGYASSMVRDNVFVPQPQTGSALHGTERSKLLKDLRVQIADVWPDKDVGYVAFSTVGRGSKWMPLSRQRVYR